MPTKLPTTTVKFKDAKELAEINRQAQAKGLSVSNYFRHLAKLKPLQHGGKRPDAGRTKKTTP